MKKSVEILGLPIISITEGTEVGTAQALVIDGTQHTVVAIAFDDGKWYKEAKLLPFDSILAIGESAITIEAVDKTLTLENAPELEQLLDADVSIVGSRVLTKGGQWKGVIAEIIIDDAGRIVSLDIENDADGALESIDGDTVYSYTKEVTVISDEKTNSTVVLQPQAVAPVAVKPEVQVEKIEPVAATPVPPVAAVVAAEPVLEKISEPAKPIVAQESSHDVAQKIEEKSKRFMIGKKASRKIQTESGLLIVDQGGEITEEVIQKAKLANKFVELTMSVQ